MGQLSTQTADQLTMAASTHAIIGDYSQQWINWAEIKAIVRSIR